MAVGEQYPDDWDTRRREVYERDDYECQNWDCHAAGGPKGDAELHAHHVTPISEGGSHDKDNLVTLCQSCHNDQHDHDITAGEQVESGGIDVAPLSGMFWQWLGGPLIFLILYYMLSASIVSFFVQILGLGVIGDVVSLALLLILATLSAYLPPARRWGIVALMPIDIWLMVELASGGTVPESLRDFGADFVINGSLLFTGMFGLQFLWLHLHLPLLLWITGRLGHYVLCHFGGVTVDIFGRDFTFGTTSNE